MLHRAVPSALAAAASPHQAKRTDCRAVISFRMLFRVYLALRARNHSFIEASSFTIKQFRRRLGLHYLLLARQQQPSTVVLAGRFLRNGHFVFPRHERLSFGPTDTNQ